VKLPYSRLSYPWNALACFLFWLIAFPLAGGLFGGILFVLLGLIFNWEITPSQLFLNGLKSLAIVCAMWGMGLGTVLGIRERHISLSGSDD